MALRLMFLPLLAVLVQGDEWKLVWNDEFDELNPDRWQHEVTAWGGGNGEFQVYTNDPANAYVRDGVLYLKPTLTKDNINPRTGKPFGEAFLRNGTLDLVGMYGYCTNSENYGCFREGVYGLIPPVMSSRIRTTKRFSYRYGKMEIEAKMPVGDWMWPAMWLLPEYWVYGPWPRSGEIDIVEILANRDYKDASSGEFIGIQKMGSTLHWGPAWDDNKYYLTHDVRTNIDYNYGDFFHNYTFLWNEEQLRIGVDGVDVLVVPRDDQLATWSGFWDYGVQEDGGWSTTDNPWEGATNMAPFDQDMHIILNVAIGGTNGIIPDNAINGNGPKPWNNSDWNAMDKFWADVDTWYPTWQAEGENSAMQVKSIKVWQMDQPVTPEPCVSGSGAPQALARIFGVLIMLITFQQLFV